MAVARDVIDMHHVTWRRDGRPILHNISWKVKKGEHWAIVGLNGSGKTSLLNLICAYEWPSQGVIRLLGEQLGQVKVNQLRRAIGWVSPALAERYLSYGRMTALEIVLSGQFASIGLWEPVEPQYRNEARAYLDRFQMGHKADQPFSHLSTGERQKVLLARAWFGQPELIILDEACAGLDLRAREELLSSLQQLGSQPDGPTMLFVTHHIEEIMPCFTHALLLKDGLVVGAGEKEKILSPHLLSQTFDLPVELTWKEGRAWVSLGANVSNVL